MYNISQFKIIKYLGLVLLLGSVLPSNAQQTVVTNLFESFLTDDARLEARAKHFYTKYKNNPNVSDVYLVKVNADLLGKESVSVQVGANTTVASRFDTKYRKADRFSWFGTLEDNSGIFFTVMDGKVASKFYLGDYAYTLLPVQDDIHFLIEYHSIDVGHCGNSFDRVEDQIREHIENQVEHRHLNDNDCNIRLLIAFTTNAENAIVTTLDQFAQFAVDETNLAYATSQVNVDLEIGITMRTTYAGVNGNNFLTDVNNFRDGNGVLAATHTMREVYNTDLQVLIRRHENGIFGRVAQVATDANPPNEALGYCVVSVTGVTDGRFSFAHEVAHLQGGRHENHNANPNFARGFVSGNGQNAWRTIVARTGAAPCNLATSCRIQQFSNPNVNGPGGVPAGTATRNNAQRLNDTRNAILAYRMTDENLTIDNETIANEMIANHLANHTITTTNTVVAEPNSLVTIRAGEDIRLTSGFHARNGSTVRVYIDNDPCEELPELRLAESEEDLAPETRRTEARLKVFPNPFSGRTTLEYELQEKGAVSITLFDTQGQRLKVLTEISDQAPGTHQQQIDVTDLPNGIYLIKLQVNDAVTIERVTLMN